MPIIIREKKLAKGKARFWLDTHFCGIRRGVYPDGLTFSQRPKSVVERQAKKEKRLIAEEIAKRMELDFLKGQYGLEEQYQTNKDFVSFMKSWIEESTGLLDIRMYKAALSFLIRFYGGEFIPCYTLNETFWKRFAAYLKNNLNGATPNNYLKKIRRVVKAAVDLKYFREEPLKNISITTKSYYEKAVLSIDELQNLLQTPCSHNEIARAFAFSAETGLRFCDIVRIKWHHIDGNLLRIIQHKTKVPVSIALKPDTLMLLGCHQAPNNYIFHLPSHTTCLKVLRNWTKEAGITKKVTWHVARHSFATNLLEHGVDVAVTSKLLGHTSLVNTQRYVRVSDSLKEQAINKLPSISKNI